MMFIIDYTIEHFQAYLDENFGELSLSKVIASEKAGEGNMNYTFRLKLENAQSLIIKQAPPYCAKFPDIAAPNDRILVESQFYSLVHSINHAKPYFPELVGVDEFNKIMLVEDLGEAEDYCFLYQQHALSLEEVKQITHALGVINAIEPEIAIDNSGMRALNHAHIFDIPLQDHNGLSLDDITPGLNAKALTLKKSVSYKKQIKDIGEHYLYVENLQTGTHLLHGDFYPGSWLKRENKIAIIDPEFGFTGAVEFDVGNLLAHMVLSQQSDGVMQSVFDNYQGHNSYDEGLALRYAGSEIMRRILGYAQLPISASLQTKARWLELSHELVTRPKRHVLLGF